MLMTVCTFSLAKTADKKFAYDNTGATTAVRLFLSCT